MAATWLSARFTRARPGPSLRWTGLLCVALLAGLGFTESLLIAELSFGLGNPSNGYANVALIHSSLLATLILTSRHWHYRRIGSWPIAHACLPHRLNSGVYNPGSPILNTIQTAGFPVVATLPSTCWAVPT
ncbi:Na+/H+ antiporter NhaA [Arthrobacter sp. GCM10027362]|uniref:Na+/H+ antiporter NhaA n=1 Tax=Arthrobacter sp. GCM10027362 TaxID=3273379 RepID=UPI003635601D